MNIFDRLRSLRRSFERYTTLIEVGISRANLLHNLHTYQETYPELSFAPVLKSNAYGHDLATVARILDREQIAFFMVDSMYEARRLRRASVRSRILVMGYARPHDFANSSLRDTDYALTDIEQIRELATVLTSSKRFHLKLDTGMHRQGILPEELDEAIALVTSNQHINIVGVCTHLGDADNPEEAYTRTCIDRWNSMLPKVLEAFPAIEYRHLAATKGVRFAKNANTNVARLGIGLYGYDTSPNSGVMLKPVLELRSIIASLRTIPAGESVGYNATYTATKPTTLATLPLGYFEGIDRRLSNNGSVEVRGKDCSIVGRISMNISSVDVTDVKDVTRGDKVTVISRNIADSNSAGSFAKLAGTIPYEILVHVPQHLRRVVE